jgi:ADP-heptose:LPS heptosyltransferase
MPAEKPVLVIHPGALGDVVLSFPAIEALSARCGAAHLLCQDQIGKAAVKLAVVDRFFPLESSRFAGLYGEFSASLEKWFSSYRAVLVLSVSRQPAARIRGHFSGCVLRIPPRPPADADRHTADHLVEQLAVKGWIDPKPADRFRDLRAPDADENCILLHPGAGSAAKRWPLACFFELAGKLSGSGMRPSFFLGPAEVGLAANIRRRHWPLFLTEDLSELIDRLRSAGALVGNDSGVSHLAAYIGLPTVAVFGPTDPGRWAPRGRAAAPVAPEKKGPFRCCGHRTDENGSNDAVEAVSVEQVLAAMAELRDFGE